MYPLVTQCDLNVAALMKLVETVKSGSLGTGDDQNVFFWVTLVPSVMKTV